MANTEEQSTPAGEATPERLAAAWPTKAFVKKFRQEFQDHVDAAKCTVA